MLDELRRGCDEAEATQWTLAVDSDLAPGPG
jgi:hypothetical protein